MYVMYVYISHDKWYTYTHVYAHMICYDMAYVIYDTCDIPYVIDGICGTHVHMNTYHMIYNKWYMSCMYIIVSYEIIIYITGVDENVPTTYISHKRDLWTPKTDLWYTRKRFMIPKIHQKRQKIHQKRPANTC